MADLIRSRLSRTAVSGMPTVMKSRALPPGYISTSTSMRCASIPKTAALRVRNRAISQRVAARRKRSREFLLDCVQEIDEILLILRAESHVEARVIEIHQLTER